jgi:hypothetical protein
MKKTAALSQSLPTAMAFFHEDGFVPAWKQAARFAGNKGHIATLPDIIEARINTNSEDVPWGMYFTTLSAEYMGYSKGGKRILIVAHGVGPMSTMDGVVEAYSFEFKDQTRNCRGGRITKKQFADLESGKYGKVSIVDFDSYFNHYVYPFSLKLKVGTAKFDPLVEARLGPRFKEYLERHSQFAKQYHKSSGHGTVINPYIISMEDNSNLSYARRRDFDDPASAILSDHLDKYDLPIAQLLSISQICYSQGNTENRFPDFFCDVSCHGWHNGTRLVGVRDKNPLASIHPGLEPREILRKHWKKLMVPTNRTGQDSGFHTLMNFGGECFTMYPKIGERMDTHEPEFLVTKNIPIGELVEFRTKGYGSPFFKYGINEVKSIAPKGANAYLLGEPQVDGDDHTCDVAFHYVEVDTTKRLPRAHDLLGDYDLLMSFL